jgi:beta-lactam-binding protein with PASTA domain
MRIMTFIAALVVLLGCTAAPKMNSVSVGMSFQQAESVLRSTGARQVQMDMRDQTEADIIRSYNLADGRVLVVAISKSENQVSKLEVCNNPDQPKAFRTYNPVPSATLTKDGDPNQVPKDTAHKLADPQH